MKLVLLESLKGFQVKQRNKQTNKQMKKKTSLLLPPYLERNLRLERRGKPAGPQV